MTIALTQTLPSALVLHTLTAANPKLHTHDACPSPEPNHGRSPRCALLDDHAFRTLTLTLPLALALPLALTLTLTLTVKVVMQAPSYRIHGT